MPWFSVPLHHEGMSRSRLAMFSFAPVFLHLVPRALPLLPRSLRGMRQRVYEVLGGHQAHESCVDGSWRLLEGCRAPIRLFPMPSVGEIEVFCLQIDLHPHRTPALPAGQVRRTVKRVELGSPSSTSAKAAKRSPSSRASGACVRCWRATAGAAGSVSAVSSGASP